MDTGFVVGDRVLRARGDIYPLWTAAYGVVGSYWVIGGSAVGHSHLFDGRNRDDAFTIRSRGPWVAAALADGVGSRPNSRYAAAFVADSLTYEVLQLVTDRAAAATTSGRDGLSPEDLETALQVFMRAADAAPSRVDGLRQCGSVTWTMAAATLRAPPPDPARLPGERASIARGEGAHAPQLDLNDLMFDAFARTRRGLASYAPHVGLELNEMSCTAMALLVNADTEDAAVAQVGDGTFIGLREDRSVGYLLNPEEAADLQLAHTLGSDNWASHLRKASLRQASSNPTVALLAMTDGVGSDLVYGPPEVLDTIITRLCDSVDQHRSPVGAAESMLGELAAYRRSGSFDDRTLVLMVKKEPHHADGNGECRNECSEPPRDSRGP